MSRTVICHFSLVQQHFIAILGVLLKSPNTTMEKFIPNPKLKLREQLGEIMRFKHFSIRTEQAYWLWIRGFILFHQKRHPREMGAPEVQALNIVSFPQLMNAVAAKR